MCLFTLRVGEGDLKTEKREKYLEGIQERSAVNLGRFSLPTHAHVLAVIKIIKAPEKQRGNR